MGKRPVKGEQMRRVYGLAMLSAAAGMIVAWIFTPFSFVAAVFLVALGFYFLFM
ncbi:MAG: hypothetical protein FWD97_09265 [Defluviitaleaceae bacterium]|nr:hypothetical protein [Defluviitaleaceae bacterium]